MKTLKTLLIILMLCISFNAYAVDIIPVKPSFFERIVRTVSVCKWNVKCYFTHKLGTTTTDISTATKFSDFPAIENANNLALNNGKIEVSTTTLPLLTTLPNLEIVGALSSGSLAGGFTAIPVALGGTGTTSPTTRRIMLGNGAGGLTVASSTGTAGQFFTSGGTGVSPSWTTSAINQAGTYDWTGLHSFSATTTMATTTITDLGVGTTTQTVTGMNIKGDVYIDNGGLGIGIATTTDDALEVAGNTLISGNLQVSGTYRGIEIIATTSAATALSTTQNDLNTIDVFCVSPQIVIGGGFLITNAADTTGHQVIENHKQDATTWRIKTKCDEASCNARNLTAYAVCIDF